MHFQFCILDFFFQNVFFDFELYFFKFRIFKSGTRIILKFSKNDKVWVKIDMVQEEVAYA